MKAASLLLLAALAAFAVFAPVLDLQYYGDDIDHLQEIGRLRSGRQTVAQWLFLPHNEHIVPLLRVMYAYFTARHGFNAEPGYWLAILWYALCGAAAALLVLRRTGSYLRACSAALLFSACGTLAPMIVTGLTAMMFTQALAFYLLALASANPWLRIGCCAAACVCFPGSFPFLAAVALDSWPQFRWRAAAACALITSGALVLHTLAHWLAGSPPKSVNPLVAPVGLWIPLTAPFRLIWSWTGSAIPSMPVIASLAVLLWVVVVLLWKRTESAAARRLLLVLFAGAVAQALVTGMGRGQDFSLKEFFWTDRYYAFFLAPAALLLACAGPRHWGLVAASALLLAPARIEINRLHSDDLKNISTVPLDGARRLAAMLLDEIKRDPSQPFTVADDFVRINDVHKGGLNLSTVVYVSFPDGLPGLRFAAQLTPQQRSRLDDFLLRWRFHNDRGY